jgi:phosphoribosyl-dephospho-CoA transferase
MAVLTDVRPHDLLRIRLSRELIADAPPWVSGALRAAPWVVVRRDTCPAGRVPVGIRGAVRAQRHAASVDAADIADVLAPDMLRDHTAGLPDVPAAAALAGVGPILDAAGVTWGPTGSTGFTLASGVMAMTAESDLDVVVRLTRLPALNTLVDWHSRLGRLPARVDCQLDLPHGGVALCDVIGTSDRVLLRTDVGPRLVTRAELEP